MSVKALEKEYNQVVAQYMEMMNDLKDMEKEASEGLVPPEFIDNLKKTIAPIKQNYEWWSYVMFTLHEPQRKAKKEKYKRMIESKLRNLDPNNSNEARIKTGETALKTLKEMRI